MRGTGFHHSIAVVGLGIVGLVATPLEKSWFTGFQPHPVFLYGEEMFVCLFISSRLAVYFSAGFVSAFLLLMFSLEKKQ